MHILLIEDDPGDRELILARLGNCHTFDCAHTLDGALLRLTQRRYDCCILDLNLPDSSGEGTLERLVRHSSGTPIVVYTGAATEELRARLETKGASVCIAKGFGTEGLLANSLNRHIQWSMNRAKAKHEFESLCAILTPKPA